LAEAADERTATFADGLQRSEQGDIMFERYTEKARRVIFFARYEASQFGSPYIETSICCSPAARGQGFDQSLPALARVGGVDSQANEEHTTIRERSPLQWTCRFPTSASGCWPTRLKKPRGWATNTLAPNICCWPAARGKMLCLGDFAGARLKLAQIREDLAASRKKSSATAASA